MNNQIIVLSLFCVLGYCSSQAQAINQPNVEKVNDSVYAVGKYANMQKQGQWVFYKYGLVTKIVSYRNDTQYFYQKHLFLQTLMILYSLN